MVKKGIENKRGGRKPLDFDMEMKVYMWYKKEIAEGRELTSKDVKSYAKEHCSVKNFNASKGWLEKFKNKYSLKLTRLKRVKSTKRIEE